MHVAEVDGQLRALYLHRDFHAQWLAEIAAVIIQKTFGLVAPVRNRFDDVARRQFGLVPDLGDAGLDGVAAVARDQLSITAHAKLAGGNLRAQIAEARVRIANIVADDLPQYLVALARLIDFKRAHLQPFGIDIGRIGRAEALVHAADVDRMRAIGGEADEFIAVEAR